MEEISKNHLILVNQGCLALIGGHTTR